MSKNFLDITGLDTYNSLIQDWVGGNHVELTQSEYDQLSTAEKNNGTEYFITNGSGGGAQFDASAITFANSGTGIQASNVQAAIVELKNAITALQTLITTNGLDSISIEDE